MISSNITLGQGISGFADKIKSFNSATKREGPEEKASFQVRENSDSGSVYSKINTNKSGYNSIYAGIRAADKTMDEISSFLNKMMTNLESTVKKTYPPYPPSSEDRTRVLKSYSSMRKLISQLTIPPDSQDAAKTLDIPELSEDAEDQSIYGAIHSIDHAVEIVRQKKAALAQDAAQITHSLHLGQGEKSEISDLPEYMVGKSVELKNSLTAEPADGLTNAKTQLAMLLE